MGKAIYINNGKFACEMTPEMKWLISFSSDGNINLPQKENKRHILTTGYPTMIKNEMLNIMTDLRTDLERIKAKALGGRNGF